MLELACIDMLMDLDSQLGRAPHELTCDLGRLRDAVLPAGKCAQHVLRVQPADPRSIHALDRHTEAPLQLRPSLELREPLVGRGDKHIAHLVEERQPELLEEADRLPRERDLRLRRELLAHPAHRLPGRPGGDLGPVGEHDVGGAALSEVVRDVRADRAGAGYDDSSHASSSARSSGVSVRSGRRTSSLIATPR